MSPYRRALLNSADRRMEESLSVTRGAEERMMVNRAMAAQQDVRSRLNAVQMANDARESERARCLRICAQFPDNLMAREIARRIKTP